MLSLHSGTMDIVLYSSWNQLNLVSLHMVFTLDSLHVSPLDRYLGTKWLYSPKIPLGMDPVTFVISEQRDMRDTCDISEIEMISSTIIEENARLAFVYMENRSLDRLR